MRTLLREKTVATLAAIMLGFGTASRRTVCQKLVAAGCRLSYSHCGQYYTLDELASYDEHSLWSHGESRSSTAGTLLATPESLVKRSSTGLFVRELGQLVQVDVQNALRKLVHSGRLERERVARRFLHSSPSQWRQRQQLRARRVLLAGESPGRLVPDSGGEQIPLATATLVSVLDERQRRLYAALESLRHGHGGDLRVAAAQLGMAPATVTKGRKQLLSGDCETDRVRKPGGGRKPLEKSARSSSPRSSKPR